MEEVLTTERKVHLISLGCARNRVDSEVMLGSLLQRGWLMTDQPADADAIVINTCGFIEAAKEESIDTILDAAEHKKEKPNLKLIVTGCLTQRYKSQLLRGMPEVDLFIGTDEFPRIADLVDRQADALDGKVFAKRTNYIYSEAMPRINTLSSHSAYVKIAEGCQHNCAFCIIPAIRGRLRSRPMDSVVSEVRRLVENGVVEINLIAQDLAAYGRDMKDTSLEDLLRKLVKVDGLKWVRLLYMYPENISETFLELLATEDKICKYLDIPVQHASDRILSLMRRDVTRAQLTATLRKVRGQVPEIAIRTTVMVGFPTETDEDFAQLKSFVKEQEFDHLGCFIYSLEEGTVAGRMKDQVPEQVKAARQEAIMGLQASISKKRLAAFQGRSCQVLIERGATTRRHGAIFVRGRLATQAPEVDGVVWVRQKAGLGNSEPLVGVQIEGADTYDLWARQV